MAELDATDGQALPAAAWSNRTAAVELMLTLGFPLDAPGQDNGTVLHCAAWQGSRASVAAVLGHPGGRALLTTRDPTHQGTPLGWCCHGSLFCRNPDGDYPGVARLLLEAGAPLDASPGDASDEVEEAIERWRLEHRDTR
jgi:hypothetical protein